MNHRAAALCAGLFVVALPLSVTAQTAPPPMKAEKTKNVRYSILETMTSRPGAETWKIISTNFIPAAKAAGVPLPVIYHSDTGKPVTMVITPLTGGTADLEWSMSPDDVKFMTALAKQQGGADKAQALMKSFNDGIESRTREIIHEHTS